jgi:radical SAM superfamily enzyme YgiQ (UPF0313 family)
MHYIEPVYRPPSEASSLIIQATLGCPHNKCQFCFIYKGKRFKIRGIEEIKSDVTQAKVLYGDSVRTIFLADGNAIVMKTDELIEILDLCHALFPNLERVTSYGAAKIILKTKTLEDMKRLRKAGLKRIHMGLESGSDKVLEMMNKGATAQEMIDASRMVKDAGMELSQYVLLGLGGKELWREHAVESARVLNAMDPDFIRVRTLLIRPDAPLYEKVAKGEFVPVTQEEILKETRLLIENLDVHSEFHSDHITNIANINGRLPQDKSMMLDRLDELIVDASRRRQDRDWAVDHEGSRGV